MPLFFWILDTTHCQLLWYQNRAKGGTLIPQGISVQIGIGLDRLRSTQPTPFDDEKKPNKRGCNATYDNHPRKTMHIIKNTERGRRPPPRYPRTLSPLPL
jgi:hypothetical protein